MSATGPGVALSVSSAAAPEADGKRIEELAGKLFACPPVAVAQ